jgi:pectate lyase
LLTSTAATLLVTSAYAQETSLPVIPGAKGFGIMTQAGRGGRIIKVTNLADSGDGSLRAALTATGRRTVIFEISGTITLLSPIEITSGNLTVAGQTAPGLGILVKGRGIVITCQPFAGGTCANDVLFQHIAIRPGDEPNPDQEEENNRDALGISSSLGRTIRRVVVDHVSLSWSVDEIISTWGSTVRSGGVVTQRSFVKDCTISNSIFSEALYNSIHEKKPHSMGVLIGSDSSNISLHRNLLAHLDDRNPLVTDDASTVQVANNYIYRPGGWASNRMKLEVGGDGGSSLVASFKSNVMVPDPANNHSTYYMIVRPRTETGAIPGNELTLYMNNNRIWYPGGSGSWWPEPIANQRADEDTLTPVYQDDDFQGLKNYPTTEPSVFTSANVNVPIIAWSQLKTHVLANAGARPFDRDPVDARIVYQVTNNTGGLINSPSQVGGYPNIPEERVTHDPPSEVADSDGDGYTDLEEWLHGKARQVELGVPAPPENLTAAVAAANDIGQINLSWTDVDDETGYRIERKKGPNGTYGEIATTAADVTSYNNAYLGTGTQYYYRVRAYNTNGDSGFSPDANATTAEVAGRQAHWKLDEATGLSAADSSGNANNGTLQSGPTWVPGRIGTGLSFDGSPTGGDDVVNAGNGASLRNLGAMTIAAWIKVGGVGEAGNPGRIVHKATGTAPVNGWQFVTQGTNQLGFAVDYTTTDLIRVSAANVFTLGGWHHVAVTWDGTGAASNVVMYVNGTAVGGYATTTNASGDRVSDEGASIHLGNEPNGARTLHGALDDVRVYDRVLDLGEIRALHRAGL